MGNSVPSADPASQSDEKVVATACGLHALREAPEAAETQDFPWAAEIAPSCDRSSLQEELVKQELKFSLLPEELRGGKELLPALSAYLRSFSPRTESIASVAKAMNTACLGFQSMCRLLSASEKPSTVPSVPAAAPSGSPETALFLQFSATLLASNAEGRAALLPALHGYFAGKAVGELAHFRALCEPLKSALIASLSDENCWVPRSLLSLLLATSDFSALLDFVIWLKSKEIDTKQWTEIETLTKFAENPSQVEPKLTELNESSQVSEMVAITALLYYGKVYTEVTVKGGKVDFAVCAGDLNAPVVKVLQGGKVKCRYGEKKDTNLGYSDGDKVGVLVDFEGRSLRFYKNGTRMDCPDITFPHSSATVYAVLHPGGRFEINESVSLPSDAPGAWVTNTPRPAQQVSESAVSSILTALKRLSEVDSTQLAALQALQSPSFGLSVSTDPSVSGKLKSLSTALAGSDLLELLVPVLDVNIHARRGAGKDCAELAGVLSELSALDSAVGRSAADAVARNFEVFYPTASEQLKVLTEALEQDSGVLREKVLKRFENPATLAKVLEGVEKDQWEHFQKTVAKKMDGDGVAWAYQKALFYKFHLASDDVRLSSLVLDYSSAVFSHLHSSLDRSQFFSSDLRLVESLCVFLSLTKADLPLVSALTPAVLDLLQALKGLRVPKPDVTISRKETVKEVTATAAQGSTEIQWEAAQSTTRVSITLSAASVQCISLTYKGETLPGSTHYDLSRPGTVGLTVKAGEEEVPGFAVTFVEYQAEVGENEDKVKRLYESVSAVALHFAERLIRGSLFPAQSTDALSALDSELVQSGIKESAWKLLDYSVSVPAGLKELCALLLEPYEPMEAPSFQRSASMMTPAQYQGEQASEEVEVLSKYLKQAEAPAKGTYTYDNSLFLEGLIEGKGNAALLWTKVRKSLGLDRKPTSAVGGTEGDRTERTVLALLLKALRVVKDVEQLSTEEKEVPELLCLLWREAFSIRSHMAQKQQTEDIAQVRANIQQLCVLMLHTDIPAFLSGITTLGQGKRQYGDLAVRALRRLSSHATATNSESLEACKRAVSVVMSFLKAGISVSSFAEAVSQRRNQAISRTLGYSLLSILLSEFSHPAAISVLSRTLKDSVYCVSSLSGIDPGLRKCLRKQFFNLWELVLRQATVRLQRKRLNTADCSEVTAALQALVFPIAQSDYATLAEFGMRSLFADLLRVAQGHVQVDSPGELVQTLCVTGFKRDGDSVTPVYEGGKPVVAVVVGEKVDGWAVCESPSVTVSYLTGHSDSVLTSFAPGAQPEFSPRKSLLQDSRDSDAQSQLQTVAWHVFKHFVYSTAVEKLAVSLDSLLVSCLTEQLKKVEGMDSVTVTDLSVVVSGTGWTKAVEGGSPLAQVEAESRERCREVAIAVRRYMMWEESGVPLTGDSVPRLDPAYDREKLRSWLTPQGKVDLSTYLQALKAEDQTPSTVLEYLNALQLPALDAESPKSVPLACLSLLWLLQLSPSWGSQRYLGVNEVKEKLLNLAFSANAFLSSLSFRVLRSLFLSSKAGIEFAAVNSQVEAITEGCRAMNLMTVLMEMVATTQLTHVAWRRRKCVLSKEAVKSQGNEASSFLLSSFESPEVASTFLSKAEESIKSLREQLQCKDFVVKWDSLRSAYFQLLGFLTILQGGKTNVVGLLKTVATENVKGIITAVGEEKVTVLVTETGKFESVEAGELSDTPGQDPSLSYFPDKNRVFTAVVSVLEALDLIDQQQFSDTEDVLPHIQLKQLLYVQSLQVARELAQDNGLLESFSDRLLPVAFAKLTNPAELLPADAVRDGKTAVFDYGDEVVIASDTSDSADLNNLFKLNKDFSATAKLVSDSSEVRMFSNQYGQVAIHSSSPASLELSLQPGMLNGAGADCSEISVFVAIGSDDEVTGTCGFALAGVTVQLRKDEQGVTCTVAEQPLFAGRENRKLYRFRAVVKQNGKVEIQSVDFNEHAVQVAVRLPGIYRLLMTPFCLFTESQPRVSLRGLSLFEGIAAISTSFFKESAVIPVASPDATDPRQCYLPLQSPSASHLLSSLTGFPSATMSAAISGLVCGHESSALSLPDIDDCVIEEVALFDSPDDVPITHTVAEYWKRGELVSDCDPDLRILAYKRVPMSQAKAAVTGLYMKAQEEVSPGMETVGKVWKTAERNACIYVLKKELPNPIHCKLRDFMFIESDVGEQVQLPVGCTLAKFLTGKEKKGTVGCPVFNICPDGSKTVILAARQNEDMMGVAARHLVFLRDSDSSKKKPDDLPVSQSAPKSVSRRRLEKFISARYSESALCCDLLASLCKVTPWAFASYLANEESFNNIIHSFATRTKQLQTILHDAAQQSPATLKPRLLQHALWQLLHVLTVQLPVAEQVPVFVESIHPYDNNMNLDQVYVIPGAQRLLIEFLPMTKTENGCDVLTFFRGPNRTEQICQMSGEFSNFKPVEVEGDRVYLYFRSDGSVVYWGYAFTITPVSGVSEMISVLPPNHHLLNPELGLWMLEESDVTSATAKGLTRVALALLHFPGSTLPTERVMQVLLRCLRHMPQREEAQAVTSLLAKQAKTMWEFSSRLDEQAMKRPLQMLLSALPVECTQTWLPEMVDVCFALGSFSARGTTAEAFLLNYLLEQKKIALEITEESEHPYSISPQRKTFSHPGVSRYLVQTSSESAFDSGHDLLVGPSFHPSDQIVPKTLILTPSEIRFSRVSLHSSYQLRQNDRAITGTQNTWSSIVLDKEVGSLAFELVVLFGNSTDNCGIGLCQYKPQYDTNSCGYPGNNFSSEVYMYSAGGCINTIDTEHRFTAKSRVTIAMDHSRTVTFKLNGKPVGQRFVPKSKKLHLYMTSHGTFNATIESYKDNSSAAEFVRNRSYTVSGDQVSVIYPVNKAFGAVHQWSESSSKEKGVVRMGAEDKDWKVFCTQSAVPAGVSCFRVRFQSLGASEAQLGIVAAGEPLDQPLNDTNCFSISSAGVCYLNSVPQDCRKFANRTQVAVLLDTFNYTIAFVVDGVEVVRAPINPRTCKKQLYFAVALSAPGQVALIDNSPLDPSLLEINASGVAQSWGLKLSISPVVTDTRGLELLERLPKEQLDIWEKEKNAHGKFTRNVDIQLVTLLDKLSAKTSKSPFDMTNSDIDLSPEALLMWPDLEKFSVEELQARINVLRTFNSIIDSGMQYVDSSVPNSLADCSELQRQMMLCKNLMFYEKKFQSLKKSLDATAGGSTPTIAVNRMRADFLRKKGRKDTNNSLSVFAQVMKAVNERPAKDLWVTERAFRVDLTGEGATDAGGPYNEIITTMCEELMSDFLPLFIPSPNSAQNIGQYRDAFIINPDATSPLHMEMYRFVGVLFGIAIRTQNNLAITLPPLFWKRIAMEPVDLLDLKGIDENGHKALELLRDPKSQNVSEEDFAQLLTEFTFTTKNSAGREVLLLPTGRSEPVTLARVHEYADLIQSMRLSENLEAYDKVREGLGSIVPLNLLMVMSCDQIEMLVCGAPEVDVERLKGNTCYEGYSADDPVVQRFWEVMAEITPEQRCLFLRFAWGRARLPSSGSFRNFKITRYDTANADQYLPLSHTCFFTIDLPPYSTKDILRNKLLYSITHCQSIDNDHDGGNLDLEE